MNHIYRLKFSPSRRELVVVSEITSTAGKNSQKGHTPRTTSPARLRSLAACALKALPAALLSLTLPLATLPAIAADLPTGGQIVGGAGSISRQGADMVIQQNTPRMAANWQSFDIGVNNRVQFVQPDSSAIALNRVTGASASQIMGQLNANGRVILVNPNGILFGKNAQVNTAGIIASTKNLAVSDFMHGCYSFSGGETAGAELINQGSLTTSPQGFIVLAGSHVSNQGSLNAPGGRVLLAAAACVTLQLDNSGLTGATVNGTTLNALIENRGLISAAGGKVWLTARGKDLLLKTLVNNSGIIDASSISQRGGEIVLSGGDSGTVTQNGRLLADSQRGHGGSIHISGQNIQLTRNSLTRASGATGGGEISTGGGWQGKNLPLPAELNGSENNITEKQQPAEQSAQIQQTVVQPAQTSPASVTISGKSTPHSGQTAGGSAIPATASVKNTDNPVMEQAAIIGGQDNKMPLPVASVSGSGISENNNTEKQQPAAQSAQIQQTVVQPTQTPPASVTISGKSTPQNGQMAGDSAIPATPLKNTENLIMEKGAIIDVSATGSGNGGTAVLWSEKYTGFYGDIYARGGSHSGDGGKVETSSRQNLQAFGSVNASAPHGRGGEWLLDPADVEIVAGADSSTMSSASVSTTDTFSPASDTAKIGASVITTALNGGNSVTIQTSGHDAAGQQGNITISTPIAKTEGGDATLTLIADNNIISKAFTSLDTSEGAANSNNLITSTSGKLNLNLFAGNTTNNSQIHIGNNSIISLNGGVFTADVGAAGKTAGNKISMLADDHFRLIADYATLETANGFTGKNSEFTTKGSLTINGPFHLTASHGSILNNKIGGTLSVTAKTGDIIIDATDHSNGVSAINFNTTGINLNAKAGKISLTALTDADNKTWKQEGQVDSNINMSVNAGYGRLNIIGAEKGNNGTPITLQGVNLYIPQFDETIITLDGNNSNEIHLIDSTLKSLSPSRSFDPRINIKTNQLTIENNVSITTDDGYVGFIVPNNNIILRKNSALTLDSLYTQLTTHGFNLLAVIAKNSIDDSFNNRSITIASLDTYTFDNPITLNNATLNVSSSQATPLTFNNTVTLNNATLSGTTISKITPVLRLINNGDGLIFNKPIILQGSKNVLYGKSTYGTGINGDALNNLFKNEHINNLSFTSISGGEEIKGITFDHPITFTDSSLDITTKKTTALSFANGITLNNATLRGTVTDGDSNGLFFNTITLQAGSQNSLYGNSKKGAGFGGSGLNSLLAGSAINNLSLTSISGGATIKGITLDHPITLTNSTLDITTNNTTALNFAKGVTLNNATLRGTVTDGGSNGLFFNKITLQAGSKNSLYGSSKTGTGIGGTGLNSLLAGSAINNLSLTSISGGAGLGGIAINHPITLTDSSLEVTTNGTSALSFTDNATLNNVTLRGTVTEGSGDGLVFASALTLQNNSENTLCGTVNSGIGLSFARPITLQEGSKNTFYGSSKTGAGIGGAAASNLFSGNLISNLTLTSISGRAGVGGITIDHPITLTDSSLEVTTNGTSALSFTDSATLNNVTLRGTVTGGAGDAVHFSGTASLTDININGTAAQGNGIYFEKQTSILKGDRQTERNQLTAKSHGFRSSALYFGSDAPATLNFTTIDATSDGNTVIFRNTASLTDININATATGSSGDALSFYDTSTLTDININATAAEGSGIYFGAKTRILKSDHQTEHNQLNAKSTGNSSTIYFGALSGETASELAFTTLNATAEGSNGAGIVFYTPTTLNNVTLCGTANGGTGLSFYHPITLQEGSKNTFYGNSKTGAGIGGTAANSLLAGSSVSNLTLTSISGGAGLGGIAIDHAITLTDSSLDITTNGTSALSFTDSATLNNVTLRGTVTEGAGDGLVFASALTLQEGSKNTLYGNSETGAGIGGAGVNGLFRNEHIDNLDFTSIGKGAGVGITVDNAITLTNSTLYVTTGSGTALSFAKKVTLNNVSLSAYAVGTGDGILIGSDFSLTNSRLAGTAYGENSAGIRQRAGRLTLTDNISEVSGFGNGDNGYGLVLEGNISGKEQDDTRVTLYGGSGNETGTGILLGKAGVITELSAINLRGKSNLQDTPLMFASGKGISIADHAIIKGMQTGDKRVTIYGSADVAGGTGVTLQNAELTDLLINGTIGGYNADRTTGIETSGTIKLTRVKLQGNITAHGYTGSGYGVTIKKGSHFTGSTEEEIYGNATDNKYSIGVLVEADPGNVTISGSASEKTGVKITAATLTDTQITGTSDEDDGISVENLLTLAGSSTLTGSTLAKAGSHAGVRIKSGIDGGNQQLTDAKQSGDDSSVHYAITGRATGQNNSVWLAGEVRNIAIQAAPFDLSAAENPAATRILINADNTSINNALISSAVTGDKQSTQDTAFAITGNHIQITDSLLKATAINHTFSFANNPTFTRSHIIASSQTDNGINITGGAKFIDSVIHGTTSATSANKAGVAIDSGSGQLNNTTLYGINEGSGTGIYTSGVVTLINTTLNGTSASNNGVFFDTDSGNLTLNNVTVNGTSNAATGEYAGVKFRAAPLFATGNSVNISGISTNWRGVDIDLAATQTANGGKLARLNLTSESGGSHSGLTIDKALILDHSSLTGKNNSSAPAVVLLASVSGDAENKSLIHGIAQRSIGIGIGQNDLLYRNIKLLGETFASGGQNDAGVVLPNSITLDNATIEGIQQNTADKNGFGIRIDNKLIIQGKDSTHRGQLIGTHQGSGSGIATNQNANGLVLNNLTLCGTSSSGDGIFLNSDLSLTNTQLTGTSGGKNSAGIHQLEGRLTITDNVSGITGTGNGGTGVLLSGTVQGFADSSGVKSAIKGIAKTADSTGIYLQVSQEKNTAANIANISFTAGLADGAKGLVTDDSIANSEAGHLTLNDVSIDITSQGDGNAVWFGNINSLTNVTIASHVTGSGAGTATRIGAISALNNVDITSTTTGSGNAMVVGDSARLTNISISGTANTGSGIQLGDDIGILKGEHQTRRNQLTASASGDQAAIVFGNNMEAELDSYETRHNINYTNICATIKGAGNGNAFQAGKFAWLNDVILNASIDGTGSGNAVSFGDNAKLTNININATAAGGTGIAFLGSASILKASDQIERNQITAKSTGAGSAMHFAGAADLTFTTLNATATGTGDGMLIGTDISLTDTRLNGTASGDNGSAGIHQQAGSKLTITDNLSAVEGNSSDLKGYGLVLEGDISGKAGDGNRITIKGTSAKGTGILLGKNGVTTQLSAVNLLGETSFPAIGGSVGMRIADGAIIQGKQTGAERVTLVGKGLRAGVILQNNALTNLIVTGETDGSGAGSGIDISGQSLTLTNSTLEGTSSGPGLIDEKVAGIHQHSGNTLTFNDALSSLTGTTTGSGITGVLLGGTVRGFADENGVKSAIKGIATTADSTGIYLQVSQEKNTAANIANISFTADLAEGADGLHADDSIANSETGHLTLNDVSIDITSQGNGDALWFGNINSLTNVTIASHVTGSGAGIATRIGANSALNNVDITSTTTGSGNAVVVGDTARLTNISISGTANTGSGIQFGRDVAIFKGNEQTRRNQLTAIASGDHDAIVFADNQYPDLYASFAGGPGNINYANICATLKGAGSGNAFRAGKSAWLNEVILNASIDGTGSGNAVYFGDNVKLTNINISGAAAGGIGIFFLGDSHILKGKNQQTRNQLTATSTGDLAGISFSDNATLDFTDINATINGSGNAVSFIDNAMLTDININGTATSGSGIHFDRNAQIAKAKGQQTRNQLTAESTADNAAIHFGDGATISFADLNGTAKGSGNAVEFMDNASLTDISISGTASDGAGISTGNGAQILKAEDQQARNQLTAESTGDNAAIHVGDGATISFADLNSTVKGSGNAVEFMDNASLTDINISGTANNGAGISIGNDAQIRKAEDQQTRNQLTAESTADNAAIHVGDGAMITFADLNGTAKGSGAGNAVEFMDNATLTDINITGIAENQGFGIKFASDTRIGKSEQQAERNQLVAQSAGGNDALSFNREATATFTDMHASTKDAYAIFFGNITRLTSSNITASVSGEGKGEAVYFRNAATLTDINITAKVQNGYGIYFSGATEILKSEPQTERNQITVQSAGDKDAVHFADTAKLMFTKLDATTEGKGDGVFFAKKADITDSLLTGQSARHGIQTEGDISLIHSQMRGISTGGGNGVRQPSGTLTVDKDSGVAGESRDTALWLGGRLKSDGEASQPLLISASQPADGVNHIMLRMMTSEELNAARAAVSRQTAAVSSNAADSNNPLSPNLPDGDAPPATEQQPASLWRQLVSDLWLQNLQPAIASQTPALQLASQLVPEGAATRYSWQPPTPPKPAPGGGGTGGGSGGGSTGGGSATGGGGSGDIGGADSSSAGSSGITPLPDTRLIPSSGDIRRQVLYHAAYLEQLATKDRSNLYSSLITEPPVVITLCRTAGDCEQITMNARPAASEPETPAPLKTSETHHQPDDITLPLISIQ